jgi:hypothetical protein
MQLKLQALPEASAPRSLNACMLCQSVIPTRASQATADSHATQGLAEFCWTELLAPAGDYLHTHRIQNGARYAAANHRRRGAGLRGLQGYARQQDVCSQHVLHRQVCIYVQENPAFLFPERLCTASSLTHTPLSDRSFSSPHLFFSSDSPLPEMSTETKDPSRVNTSPLVDRALDSALDFLQDAEVEGEVTINYMFYMLLY